MGSACSSCSTVTQPAVDNEYFVLYVPTVGFCVYCDISARLIRSNYFYATYYMGLFFDMRVSTYLIPFLLCPNMIYSLQFVYIYGIIFSQFYGV
jgi:hypothetical protein